MKAVLRAVQMNNDKVGVWSRPHCSGGGLMIKYYKHISKD